MNLLKKIPKFLFVLSSILCINNAFLFATHNRAGEITLRQINDLTYEITITTYTYTLSGADRPELEVQWGDNSVSIAPRIQITNLPNDYRRNVYTKQHTYPGPGTYTIVVQDPNRNYGVKNIPNSVNVIFSIKTTISINPQIGKNSTPLLLNPPFDKAGLNQRFIHNPGAFDPDGDSISYSLTVCTEQNGQPIPGYTYPKASDSLYVNPVTGDLVWNAPVDTGIYNIAMNIEEWRKGVKIGNIVRDMQVEVYRTTNLPPVNEVTPKLCVIAGTNIELEIKSTDPNNDNMLHFLTGGPYIVQNEATDTIILDQPGELISRFRWKTNCSNVRKQPYTVLIKTTDLNSKLSLVTITNLDINVLGPPPENISLVPASNQVRVQWTAGECGTISYYNIYRRTDESGYVPDSCTYGLPGFSGFSLIGHTAGANDNFFIDNNKGEGLLQGTNYCYRVVAVYPDGAESIPSDEVCTVLTPGSPLLLNTSVTKSDGLTGEIYVSWAKPLSLDTIPALGPYEYILYRSDNLFGTNPTEIYRFSTSDLNDTVYLDKNINTLNYPYTYSVELYNNAPGNRFIIGKPEIASTIYAEATPTDKSINLRLVKNVPWMNYENIIYRHNTFTDTYDSIGFTSGEFFTDNNLVNGESYCYKVISKGQRNISGAEYHMENISHITCATPFDNIPPCPPLLTAVSECDSGMNILSWTNQSLECSADISYYKIYYTPQLDLEYSLLDSTSNLKYIHIPSESLAACYYLVAVDSTGNQSNPSGIICLDECYNYEIPNVFSPNGDEINDILHPFPYSFVEKIDLKIFNRWGQLIFRTEDPDINWDGKIEKSNQIVSTGVYYYICDVYEKRLTGTEVRNIVGFIHVYSDKSQKPEK